ncbi:MAG: ATP-dependent Clp protease ATP-binding subunit [Candidatus Kerfeldbacteria bacterium]|nr:ATP-dependent Clp protease ATP-binding subunit [Candidatus Kerfeldbacteria bacterium]
MPLDILNKFTTNLKNTLVRAINLSIRLKHPQVLPLHLLISLTEQSGSLANEIIAKHKLSTEVLQPHLSEINWPNTNQRLFTLPQLSAEAVRVLEHAAVVAFEYQHKYVGTEHLLLSIIELPDKHLSQIFKGHQVNVEQIRKQTLTILKSTSRFPDFTTVFQEELEEAEQVKEDTGTNQPASNTPALDFFSVNLTTATIQKNIDPVIGRAEEIDRLIHILCRRTKNNPVLLGEPGVGKTAIVEGLAKRILEGQVPSVLLNKKIFRLDLGLVVAGTMYRGEFEARFKQITEELKDNTDIILFIDEIHTLIGAGGTGGNAMDAANILKPGLARGEIRCIGATTVQEYQKHIEADAALERRFQPIYVEEPSMDEAIQVLRGVKPSYEKFHQVTIADSAIEAAVKLSQRYIQNKFLPDKAIDLIDEAAARYRVRKPIHPLEQNLHGLENNVRVVQKEKLALVKEEKFEQAIELKHKEQQLKLQIDDVRKRLTKTHQKSLGSISDADIATIIARITKVPVEDLLAPEKKRLLNLQHTLNQHVVGQTEATQAVAEFIRRSRAGLTHPDRPIGSFLFLGPSGVGKTELAKTLAKTVFGDEHNFIRIDMSEFAEGFTVSKLIGAPAGYVGYKEGAKLTDQVKHKPYSLVLFDEIEKAHRDVFNLLLQILDEGHLTDATGKKVNFKNTIIIMTSNVGLQKFQEQANLGFRTNQSDQVSYDQIKNEVLRELKFQFRPELLNRIDKIIVFRPLGETELIKIAQLQLQDLIDRLQEKRISLTASKLVLKHIAKLGYTPTEGARAMRRTIQELIENPLAEKILNDDIGPGQTIQLGLTKSKITFTPRA